MPITPVQQICPSSKWNIKCPYTMVPEYITVHNTANQASALNEITYMNNNNAQVSYHFAIDDKEVRQGIPTNRNAWHAGDGANGKGNRKTIGIEICYSKDGGTKFDRAEQLAARFIAQLLKEYKWGVDRVKKHQDWSGKYCPHRTLDYGWQRFINMIQKELDILTKPPISWIDQPSKSYTTITQTNLVNLETGQPIRSYMAGVYMDFVQHCTYNGRAYYRTQYSKDKNVNNGVPITDVTEVIPENEKVKWTPIKGGPKKMVALRDCVLLDVKTKAIKKTFNPGDIIENLVDEATVGLEHYYRTQYSKDQKKSYGIEVYQLAEYEPPKDEPKEDLPTEDLIPPIDAGVIDGDVEKIPNWFKMFVEAIINFVKSLFKKEKK